MYLSILKWILGIKLTKYLLFWHAIKLIILNIYCWINAYEFEQHNDTGIWVLEIFLDNFFITPVPVAILNIKEHVFFVLLEFRIRIEFRIEFSNGGDVFFLWLPIEFWIQPQLQQLDLAKGSVKILHVSPRV